MTESQIRRLIINSYYKNKSASSYKMMIPNVYLYKWEADLLGITKSNYVHEFEIKTTFQDFKNEFIHKFEKHNLFKTPYDIDAIPNRLYYVCETGVIPEVPEYAGLIHTVNRGLKKSLRIIKKAPLLHNEKFEDWENIAKKLFYKTI